MRKQQTVFSVILVVVLVVSGTSFAQTGEMAHTGPHQANPAFTPDVEIALTATPATVTIFPDTLTEVWMYQGKLLKGAAENLTFMPQSYLGPTIRVRHGQKIRVHFTNQLPEANIIHWHGLHVPANMDGHPRDALAPGASFVYEFEVRDRAGTYWYHPHPDQLTGSQVYFGLAGLLIIEDAEEQHVALPAGEFDLPLVIQDRTFQPDGSLQYFSETLKDGVKITAGLASHKTNTGMGHGHAMTGMPGMAQTVTGADAAQRSHGVSGETILVNGTPDATISVKTAVYRLRLLNGSNARIYKLAWSHGVPFTVIGTDGGLLDAPVQKEYVVLGPGERIETLVDFSTASPGTTLQLRSSAFAPGMAMPMGGADMASHGMDPEHGGAELRIADFVVREGTQHITPLPAQLAKLDAPQINAAVNLANPRTFKFETTGARMTINGRSFEMHAVAPDEIVKLGATEVWELSNGGQNPMPHPVHIHGLQFRVLAREGSPQEFEDGYVDQGWKDTVLLMPGEKVRLLLRFTDFTGMYVYHCHLLEHEDLGMMRNYQIVP